VDASGTNIAPPAGGVGQAARFHHHSRESKEATMDHDEHRRRNLDNARDLRDGGPRGRPGQRPEPRRNDRFETQSQFSPDWSRDDAEPIYSSEQYYARNRDYERANDFWEHGQRGGWQGDQGRTTTSEQRDRGFMPREQYEREHYGAQHDDFGGSQRYAAPWHTGPHTGRGPKGYKRSDDRIIEDASQRLEHDGHVDASDIEVTADNGVIHLRGVVPDRAMKRRAEQCVETVYGVRDVMNELRIGSGGEHPQRAERRTDSRGSQSTQAESSATLEARTQDESGDQPRH
jgi:osmotically-inducible protein OsmY